VVYFWGGYVAFNTCHTAFCGVFGRWYFGMKESVCDSLKVAVGPAFGSICFGSLVIAIIRAMEQLARKLRGDAQSEGNVVGMVVACVLQCVISCIGDILEWISQYIYVQVALRGLSFLDGAKATYALATISNLVYVCSAILVTYVALLGSILCALSGAAIAGVFSYYTCGIPGVCVQLAMMGGMFGCIGGCLAGGNAVGIINSGAVSIIMCWAERPDILQRTNKDIAERFEQATRKAFGDDGPQNF